MRTQPRTQSMPDRSFHHNWPTMSVDNNLLTFTKDILWQDSKFKLMAQVPSMEEMKSEVANITCQMQSVYLEKDSPLPSKSIERQSVVDGQTVTYSDSDESERETLTNDGRGKFNTLGGYLQQFSKSPNQSDQNWLLRTNATDKMNVFRTSLPREEHISAEFDMDGRRFRQTYKRRVTLERKTSKEVIFLPASSMDGSSERTPNTSPEFVSPSSSQCEQPNGQTSRPLLDLSVLHCPPIPNHESCCLTPTVVLHTAPARTRESSMNPSVASHPVNSKMLRRLSWTASAGFPGPSFSHQVKRGDNNIAYLSNSPRRLLRDLVESARKRLKINRSTESSVHEKSSKNDQEAMNSCLLGEQQKDSLRPAEHELATKNMQQKGASHNREMFGYMYQFGVWDDQSPVLDPRLPITNELNTKRGTAVIPKSPEWHHAEVGLDSNNAMNGIQEPLVRGRIVACLQRFTQHSATSGKLLHRSTYVQQTRLFRQRDRHGTVKNTDDPSMETNGDQPSSNGQLESFPTFHHLKLTDEMAHDKPCGRREINLESARVNANPLDSVSIPGDSQPARCSAERLQLLQSICPAAAAATTLLGRQFIVDRISASDTESEEDRTNTRTNYLQCPLVTATSWCPPALITRDPSPYLIFQNNGKEQAFASTKSKAKGSSDLPQPLIRGGTLDGLIAYTLQSLKQNSTASQWDNLFPHVFLVTYPTFTTTERMIKKLIQLYVALAPMEPGCLNSGWDDALLVANILLVVALELPPNELTTRLVLQLARFARLLILDGLERVEHPIANGDVLQTGTADIHKLGHLRTYFFEHKALADRLFENLPLISATARLRERMTHSGGRTRRRCEVSRAESVNSTKTSCQRSVERLAVGHQMNTPSTDGKPSSDKGSHSEEPNNLTSALRRVEQFIKCDSQLLANEITRMEEEMFAQINFHEFLDIHRLERGESPTLGRCVEHFNRTTSWARSLLFLLGPAFGQRMSTKTYTGQREGAVLESNHRHIHRKGGGSVHRHQDKHNKHRSIDVEEVSLHITRNGDFALHNSKLLEDITPGGQTTISTNVTLASITTAERRIFRIQHLYYMNVVFEKLCDVLKHLKALKNFSSFLAVLLAVQQVPESLLSRRSKALVSKFSSYMRPPMFTEYRRDLEASSLPCLPYLGLIFQQLIHLHAGNSVYLNSEPGEISMEDPLDETVHLMDGNVSCTRLPSTPTEQIINVWRCWKHYLILGYFLKRKEDPEKNLHHIPCIKEVQSIINGFRDTFPESLLEEAKEKLIQNVKMKRTQTFSHAK